MMVGVRSRRTAVATVMIVAVAGPAVAQDVCVVCEEPAAVYRCTAEGTNRATDSRVALACITELARSGGHANCSARRQSGQTCEGPQRTVDLSAAAGLAAAPPQSAVGRPEPPPLPAEPPASAGPKAPPETMEQLARQAAQASKDQLRKAGETVSDTAETVGDAAKKAGNSVGTAAKKTWHCLTSLFKEC